MSGYNPPPGPYIPGGGAMPGAPQQFQGAGPPPPAGVRPPFGAPPAGLVPPPGPFAAPPPAALPNGPAMPFAGNPPSGAASGHRPAYPPPGPSMPAPPAPPSAFAAGPRGPPPSGLMPPPPMPGGARPAMPPGPPGMPPPMLRPPMPGGAVPAAAAGAPPGMLGMQPPAAPFAPGMMPGPPPPGGMVPGPPGTAAGAAAGMMPPPPGGMMPGQVPPPPIPGQQQMGPPGAYPGYGAQYGQQQLLEQFESLAIGAAPGQAEVDIAALPRPCGPSMQQAYAAAPSSDLANCSPHNMRLTLNAIPNTSTLKSRWPLPLGLIVQPMADDALGRHVPLVPLGSAGIVRCRRCRTYMNPFMQWSDGGRRFKCNVCGQGNEAPPEYYCQLDASGRRLDQHERPELNRGTVEYVAPAEYMVRPPMPPVFFFVIDVSYTAVASGMLAVVAGAIKESLDKLPGEERTMVGFLTFDSTLHFYNLKTGLSQPQVLVVSELDEPFLPLPDDLLVNLADSREVVEALLDSLPSMFQHNRTPESAMGPALQAAFLVTNHMGGKMLLFQSGVPSLGAGKVRQRENYALYNTEREASLRQPEDAFYKRFAGECSRVQCTLDIFAFNSQYMDLASLSTIPHYNSGQVHHYPGFNAARDGAKLHAELCHNLQRTTAWEAVMRIRCSKGLKISHFHGHFFNRSTDLLALPTCSPDMAYAVQLQHDEAVVTSSVVYIQCALLFTSSSGERRIRVHTMVVPVVSELPDLYRAVDVGATAAMLAKLAVERSMSARLEECRQALQQKVVGVLKEYRMLHAAHLRGGARLIFPESLRYLAVFTLGLLKSAALRGSGRDVAPDERVVVGHALVAAPVDLALRMLYPAAYPLHDPAGEWGQPGEDSEVKLPETVPLSLAYMVEAGAYLVDTGRLLVLWLGRALAPQWVADVFGIPVGAVATTEPQQLVLEPPKAHPMSKRVNALVHALRGRYGEHQEVFVVKQGTPMEAHVVPYFIEDRSHGQLSYADWVMALHKAVMSK